MTLFTTNSVLAIFGSALLSIFWLGEKFICFYDTIAAFFICSGSALTILQMNIEKEDSFSKDEVT